MPVRELKCIVMGHGVVRVDLPEAREPLFNFLIRENADAERRLAFDVLVERNLGARQQTDRNMRLPDRGEAAGDGIAELGRHQLVLDLGRPGRDMVQTIVTHRRDSGAAAPDVVRRRYMRRNSVPTRHVSGWLSQGGKEVFPCAATKSSTRVSNLMVDVFVRRRFTVLVRLPSENFLHPHDDPR
jgi:hypothetical protein